DPGHLSQSCFVMVRPAPTRAPFGALGPGLFRAPSAGTKARARSSVRFRPRAIPGAAALVRALPVTGEGPRSPPLGGADAGHRASPRAFSLFSGGGPSGASAPEVHHQR